MRLLAKDPDERPESAPAIPELVKLIVDAGTTTAGQAAQEEANPLDRLAGGVFVGREKEMDELRAGLEDALSGHGRRLRHDRPAGRPSRAARPGRRRREFYPKLAWVTC